MTTQATNPSPTLGSNGPLAFLRPQPFRGDLIAAGAVVLAVGVLLIDSRFHQDWSDFVRFLVVAVPAALLLIMAWQAPAEGDLPRTYVSVLLVAGFVLELTALDNLSQVLGSAGVRHSDNTAVWVGLVLGGGFLMLAAAKNSAVCTLLASVTLTITLVVAVHWVFNTHSVNAFRWTLLVSILALAGLATARREEAPRHSVAHVNAAGVAALGIAVFTVGALFTGALSSAFSGGGGGLRGSSTWWEIVLLVLGCGLIAVASADREPGPAYLGVVVLILYVVAAFPGDSLIGWPLILVLLGGGALVAGLRPTTPAPPAPNASAPAAPTTPITPPRPPAPPPATME